jgi:hypothetical protein
MSGGRALPFLKYWLRNRARRPANFTAPPPRPCKAENRLSQPGMQLMNQGKCHRVRCKRPCSLFRAGHGGRASPGLMTHDPPHRVSRAATEAAPSNGPARWRGRFGTSCTGRDRAGVRRSGLVTARGPVPRSQSRAPSWATSTAGRSAVAALRRDANLEPRAAAPPSRSSRAVWFDPPGCRPAVAGSPCCRGSAVQSATLARAR